MLQLGKNCTLYLLYRTLLALSPQTSKPAKKWLLKVLVSCHFSNSYQLQHSVSNDVKWRSHVASRTDMNKN
jgi:hypothetical protein